MTTVQVGIRVPTPLYEKLKNHADQVSLSRSEVILSALAKYLESAEDVPLSVRMAELEKRMAEVETWVKVADAEERT